MMFVMLLCMSVHPHLSHSRVELTTMQDIKNDFGYNRDRSVVLPHQQRQETTTRLVDLFSGGNEPY
jgi:hypothetical protein